MKSKSKRLLSTLLVFALVFGLLTAMPTTASAATTHTAGSEHELETLLETVANAGTFSNYSKAATCAEASAIISRVILPATRISGKTL